MPSMSHYCNEDIYVAHGNEVCGTDSVDVTFVWLICVTQQDSKIQLNVFLPLPTVSR